MTDAKLINDIAILRFESGYKFEDGTAFFQVLGPKRARELVQALGSSGYRITKDVESPRIADARILEEHSR